MILASWTIRYPAPYSGCQHHIPSPLVPPHLSPSHPTPSHPVLQESFSNVDKAKITGDDAIVQIELPDGTKLTKTHYEGAEIVLALKSPAEGEVRKEMLYLNNKVDAGANILPVVRKEWPDSWKALKGSEEPRQFDVTIDETVTEQNIEVVAVDRPARTITVRSASPHWHICISSFVIPVLQRTLPRNRTRTSLVALDHAASSESVIAVPF